MFKFINIMWPSFIKLLFLYILSVNTGCKKKSVDSNTSSPTFAKGADISWITQMEANGIKFYNRSGVQEDEFQLMKDLGMNSIRLRVWVNPSGGWCNTSDVVNKAIRAKNAGLQLLI